jgi:hypothetical protein
MSIETDSDAFARSPDEFVSKAKAFSLSVGLTLGGALTGGTTLLIGAATGGTDSGITTMLVGSGIVQSPDVDQPKEQLGLSGGKVIDGAGFPIASQDQPRRSLGCPQRISLKQ